MDNQYGIKITLADLGEDRTAVKAVMDREMTDQEKLALAFAVVDAAVGMVEEVTIKKGLPAGIGTIPVIIEDLAREAYKRRHKMETDFTFEEMKS